MQSRSRPRAEMSKKLLLCFGDRRTPVEISSDGSREETECAARRVFGDAISGLPLLQIWSQEWDSWVDLSASDGDLVPPMSKILVVPQLQDLSQGNRESSKKSFQAKRDLCAKMKEKLAVIAEKEKEKKQKEKLNTTLLKLNLNLKMSLTVEAPDITRCLRILNDLSTFPVTHDMLAENPDVIETLKKVRKYKASEKVMSRAAPIYKKYKAVWLDDLTDEEEEKQEEEDDTKDDVIMFSTEQRTDSSDNDEKEEEEKKKEMVAMEMEDRIGDEKRRVDEEKEKEEASKESNEMGKEAGSDDREKDRRETKSKDEQKEVEESDKKETDVKNETSISEGVEKQSSNLQESGKGNPDPKTADQPVDGHQTENV